MSIAQASGPPPYAANTKNAQQWSCNTNPRAETDAHWAPYTPAGKWRVPGSYIIMFHPGHKIEKQFAFLGLEFEVKSWKAGYCAALDDQLFNAIRYDPGVSYVEDDTFGTRD